MNELNDTTTDRVGEWMRTSTGGRFYPLDPRPEEIDILDIANGLALGCRYAGQGRIDRFYSIAEHSVLLARYVYERYPSVPKVALVVALHDAAEGYLTDLPRAVKHAVGSPYSTMEDEIETMIWEKYGVAAEATNNKQFIKDLDRRIVPLEKNFIMSNPRPWAYDKFEPLEGVAIKCWSPERARFEFMKVFDELVSEIAVLDAEGDPT